MIKCEHKWRTIKQPEGHNSGEHVEQCALCGETLVYDTSD